MVPLIVVVPAVLALLYVYLFWTYSYWYRRGISQGNPLLLFAGANDFAISRINYFTLYDTTYKKNTVSPFQGVYSFLMPILFLRDPEIIKDVLTKNFQKFPDTASQITDDIDPIFSRDPFFQSGKQWKDGRADLSTLLTPARLRIMHSQIMGASDSMMDYIRNFKHESGVGDGADIKDICTRYITEVMIAILLGGRANAFKDESNVFLDIGKYMFEDTYERKIVMMSIIGAPHIAKILKLRLLPKKAAEFLGKVVRAEADKRKTSETNPNALLDALLKKYEKNENKEEVATAMIAFIVIFFIEGLESMSLVATYTLLNLAKNPEVQERLRQIVLEVAPRGKDFQDDFVNELQFLQNCVLESMRLHPPVTMLQRKTGEDVTLTARTGEEVFVKKGTIVNLPVYGVHHDATVFTDPDTYDPDRFLDEAQRRMFIGFGDGPRQCMGRRYSVQVIGTMVAAILRDFRLELSPKTKFPITFASHPFFLYPTEKLYLRFVSL